MKQSISILFLFCCTSVGVNAQPPMPANDSGTGKITVYKDSRLDELAKKEAAFNENAIRTGKGYRLLIMSSNDRNLVLKVRTQLLQRYPEQKVYMSFQPPYIKLKFGNFLEKADAENYKKEMLKNKLVTTNIYTVPENIEVKPDKNKDKEKESQ